MSPRILPLLSLLLLPSLHAVTRNVNPGNAREVPIQNAINASVSGDIVLLKAGDHYLTGEVQLPAGKNGVIIRAETGAIVRKASNSNISAFRVDGNNNTFDKVEIDGGLKPQNGVLVFGDGTRFLNCKFHHCGNAGILFQDAVNSVVTGGAYNNNGGVGISQNNSPGADITGASSSSRVLANNNGLEALTIDLGSDNCFVQYMTGNTNQGGVGNVGEDDANGAWLYNCIFNGHPKRSGVSFQNNVGPCDGPRIWNSTLNNNNDYPIHIRNVQYPVTNAGFQGNTYTGNALGNFVFTGPTP